MEAIAAYMSHECACPKEDYKGRLMESILKEALFDYLNSANKPGFDLRHLFHQYALSDPSLSERICTMFQLVTVRDDSGQYTNGFTDKLMAQSENCRLASDGGCGSWRTPYKSLHPFYP